MRNFILGVIASLLITACASSAYTSYIMDPVSWEGTLRARKQSDDLPLSTCQPDDASKDKCRVVLTAEWERMNSDIINLQQRLKACEQGQ